MFETQFRVWFIALIPLLAFTLMSGCATAGKDAKTNDSANVRAVATKVEDVPLLVHFNEAGCPTAVTKVVESCGPTAIPLPPGVPLTAELACREKDQKVVWLAVTDGPAGAPSLSGIPFTIAFTEGTDPTDVHCKGSTDGVLECHVKRKTDGTSKYVVKPDGLKCELDPRFYVP